MERIDNRKVLEELAKEKLGTPVGILYYEAETFTLKETNLFEVTGKLQGFYKTDEEVILNNGNNIVPFRIWSKTYSSTPIPSNKILSYCVLKAEKEITCLPN